MKISDKKPLAILALTLVLSMTFLLTASPARASVFNVGSEPRGVAVASSNGDVYATNYLASTVSVIDPSSNTVVATIPVGLHPIGIAYDPSNKYIYAANEADTTVSVIDTSSNTVVDTLTPPGVPMQLGGVAFVPSNGYIYVTDVFNKQVYAYDPSSDTFVKTINVCSAPYGLTYDDTNGDLYLACGGAVDIVDPSTNSVVGSAPGGVDSGIAYASSDNELYVGSSGGDAVLGIDVTTNTVAVTIPLPSGSTPYGVVFDPTNNDVFVACYGTSMVSVIDTSSDTVVSTRAVGMNPEGMAYSSTDGQVYVANAGSDSVTAMGALSFGGLAGISTSLSSLATSLGNVQTTVSGLSTSLSSDFGSLSSQVTTLSSTLSTDFNSLSTAISNIGVNGPTVGTSNDATVATSPALSSRTSFGTAPSSWTQVAGGVSSVRVMSGYAVSTRSVAGTRNAILYVSLSNSPSSAGATYAIPLGQLDSLASPSGQLRFPFEIPANSAVYVQVVSSSSVSVTVQLQLLSIPISS